MSDPETRVVPAAVDEASSEKLGLRVKELRCRKGMTLNELAEASGVSRAMISKVERGEKNPTLVVTARLSEGLGVTLSQLAGVERNRAVAVVTRDRRMIMQDPETGFERQLLSPSPNRQGIEFIRNVIPEGSTSGEFPPHRKGVEEYLVVEQGRVTVVLDGEEYYLKEGDALYFEADVAHRFDNAGTGEASYYLVIVTGSA